jgi:glycine oxidase
MDAMKNFDTVIIGGGIIGCSLARLLAGEKLRVAVAERGAPGEEASWAAAGMLAPSAEATGESPLFDLAWASIKMYPALAAELQSETGIDPQYRAEGTLFLYENEQEREAMLRSVIWQRKAGISIDELSTSGLREREPELSPAAPGGFYLAEDHQIDNRLLMRALVESCRRRGVEFLLGKTVRQVERNGHGASGVLMENEKIAAGRVVNTAGAWAGLVSIPGLPPAPIRPVKGHIIALENPQAPLRHVVRSHRVYLVPRRDGRVIVGSTMEEAGFDKTPRAGPVARLLGAAQQVCPVLEKSRIADIWAGLRPAAPDSLPLLGPTSLDGYWVALGHFRNGILLAPVTARILSSWLLTGKPAIPVDALLPQRFEK